VGATGGARKQEGSEHVKPTGSARPLPVARKPASWCFRLYVADLTPRAMQTMKNLDEFCRAHLPAGYHFKVVDALKHPRQARADQIVALPTLIRLSPAPTRRVIGDLSDTAKVLAGLDVRPNEKEPGRGT
jgi:circadian clock protein KaiB